MIIEVKNILPNDEMIIKLIKPNGQFPETKPEEGKIYSSFFEEIKEHPVPEFNQ